VPTWIDGLRARCGPLTDAASIFAVQLGVERDPPAGVDGLIALTRALRRQRADAAADEDDDRMLVELAGAYLALVLCRQLGGAHVSRDGRHGLRLGRRGFFDPFTAVEAAFEADDVRAALCRAVADAEAEAKDGGPIARVVHEIERQLRERPGSPALGWQFGAQLSVELDGSSVQLDANDVVRACRGEPDAVVARAVSKLLAALPQLNRETSWEQARHSVVPRLAGPEFLNGLQQRSARHALCTLPLAGELRVAFVLRTDTRARYVHAGDLRAWGCELDALYAAALRNLAGASERARLLRADGDEGGFVVARSGDGLDSSRLLLPGLQALIAAELGSPFAAAVPHRDALFACALDAPRALAALRERARREAGAARHAISAQLFEVRAAGELIALPAS
jgi:uncharacterized protein YtpQ (UPF0354 family)